MNQEQVYKKKKFNNSEAKSVPQKDTQFNDLMPQSSKFEQKSGNKANFNNNKQNFKTQDHSNKKAWKGKEGSFIAKDGSKNTGNTRNFSPAANNSKGGDFNNYNKNKFGGKPQYNNSQNFQKGGRGATPNKYNKNQTPNTSKAQTPGGRTPYKAEGEDATTEKKSKQDHKGTVTAITLNIVKKNNEAEERIKHVQEGLTMINSDFDGVVLKRYGSRLIQACLKHGNKTQREAVFGRILKSNLDDVLRSQYGQFLMKKMCLYVTAKNVVKPLNTYIDKKFFSLLKNPNSCKAMHDYLEAMNDIKRLAF